MNILKMDNDTDCLRDEIKYLNNKKIEIFRYEKLFFCKIFLINIRRSIYI